MKTAMRLHLHLLVILLFALLTGFLGVPAISQPQIHGPDLDASPVQHLILEGKTVTATDVPVEAHDKDLDAPPPKLAGHPLTSVIVTQCSLIVAVYMTMPDGKLLRFDHRASETMKADQLLQLAYTADRSERLEISCDGAEATVDRRDPI